MSSSSLLFLPIDRVLIWMVLVQMRVWNKTMEDVPGLIQAHFANDPYYPRARDADPLYPSFKKGYMSAVPDESAKIGAAFLAGIEEEQAVRDAQ